MPSKAWDLMHFGRLFDVATASSTGALIVLSIACGVVLLGVWVSERRLKRQQLRRELEAEIEAAKRERTERQVLNAVNRFRRM